MKKKIKYTHEYMDIGDIVDILPSPSHLVSMIQTDRATLTLTRSTLNFFKKQPKKIM